MPGWEWTQKQPRPPLLHRISPWQLQLVDVLIGFLVLFVRAHTAVTVQQGPFPVVTRPLPGPEIALAAVGAAIAVALRRRIPMTALALITLCISLGAGTGTTPILDPFIGIPMYQVASTYERRRSLPALIVVASLLVSVSALRSVALHHADLETLGLVVVIAVVVRG